MGKTTRDNLKNNRKQLLGKKTNRTKGGKRNSDWSHAEAQRGGGAEGLGRQKLTRSRGDAERRQKAQKDKKYMEKEDGHASFLFLSLQSVRSAVTGRSRPTHHGAAHVGLKKKGS